MCADDYSMQPELHPGPGIGEDLDMLVEPRLVQIGWWNPKARPKFFTYGGGPGDVPVYAEKRLVLPLDAPGLIEEAQ